GTCHHPGCTRRAARSRHPAGRRAGASQGRAMSLVAIGLATLIFVLLNALFVAAEFALIGASRLTLEQRAPGDRLAAGVLRIVSSTVGQDRYLATAQLGITVASLGLGMFGEHQLAEYVTEHVPALALIGGAAGAAFVSITLLTIAHIVVGEMLPKGLALQNPIRIARLAYVPMRVAFFTFYPLVVLLNGLANFSLRLIGVRRQQNVSEHLYSPEELQLIVEESEKGGRLLGGAGRLLRELFEFGDLTAGQAMVPRVRVIGIPLGADRDALADVVRTHRRTRYPVYRNDLDDVVGMVHAKDLLRCMMHGESLTEERTRPLPVVPEAATLDAVL